MSCSASLCHERSRNGIEMPRAGTAIQLARFGKRPLAHENSATIRVETRRQNDTPFRAPHQVSSRYRDAGEG